MCFSVCAESVGVPAAWIFGFLIVFGVYAIFADRQVKPPKNAMTPAQVIIALLCSAPLAAVTPAQILSYAWPTLISLVTTLAVCALAAFLLVRLRGVGADTSILATLAGGASAMVMLAGELKADVRFVTLTQYLRLSVVVLTLPAFVAWLSAGQSPGSAADGGEGDGVDAAGLLSALDTSWQPILGVAGAWATVWLIVRLTSRWFTISSPYLLVTIALGVVVALAASSFPSLAWLQDCAQPDGLTVNLAYALIGVQAGGTLTKGALRTFRDSLPVILTVIGLMIASSVAVAYVIAALGRFNVLEAYLATVPGGIYAVLAFAHEAGADPIVTVVQVMRVIVMLVVGAYAPQIIAAVTRRTQVGGAEPRNADPSS